MRLKFYFNYLGTLYHGFQRQANTQKTVQEVLETKISMIANARTTLMASGRTDAGVHARIQVAHADVPDLDRAPQLAPSRLLPALNSVLPRDIRMLRIDQVPGSFHALRDVKKKTYLYFIDPSPIQLPELRNHSWHLRFPLDLNAMMQATPNFLGEHDFRAFCAADTTARSTVRTLYEARWGEHNWHGIGGSAKLLVFRVTGSGFLKNMVRSMLGSLVHIGNGKANPDLICRGLQTRDRRLAGPSAPAHGLWLWDILY